MKAQVDEPLLIPPGKGISYMCGSKKQSLWFCGLQVLEKHSYVPNATYIT